MAFFGKKQPFEFMPEMGGMDFSLPDLAGPLQANVNQAIASPAPQKKGFFKGGDGFDFWDIIGGIGDGLSGNPIYASAAQQQRRAQQEAEEYQRRRGDNLEDYAAKQAIDQRYAAPKDRKTIVIDGVVFDAETGEPLFESPYPDVIAGPDGSFLERPRMGLGRKYGVPSPTQQTPPILTDEDILRMGGPSPAGSGGFSGY